MCRGKTSTRSTVIFTIYVYKISFGSEKMNENLTQGSPKNCTEWQKKKSWTYATFFFFSYLCEFDSIQVHKNLRRKIRTNVIYFVITNKYKFSILIEPSFAQEFFVNNDLSLCIDRKIIGILFPIFPSTIISRMNILSRLAWGNASIWWKSQISSLNIDYF